MSRFRWLAVAVILLAFLPRAMGFPVSQAIRVVTGLTSHTLCSQVFLTGLDADRVYTETVRPQAGVGLLSWGIRYRVDRSARSVRTTFLGGFASQASYVTGSGCVLGGGSSGSPEPVMPETAPVVPGEKIAEALQSSNAIVVMRDDEILGEGYAPGYNVTSRVPGWSASKSVINALIGILVRDGRLDVNHRAPIAEWAGDTRREITVDNLLRMTSGLDLDETNSGFDPAARMLFIERDMAAFAVRGPRKLAPGTKMNYTDCNTLILSRILRDVVGGDVLAFARKELFEPLGIHNMTIELDAAGTPVGATQVFGPARDWARFGMLYARDGVVNGRRVLPEGWVRYSSEPTLGTRYAAGFWTHVGQASSRFPGDSFFASGHLGQKVLIVPSQRLVIARFATIHKPADGDMAGLAQLYEAFR